MAKVGLKRIGDKQTGRNQYSILVQIYSIVHTFTSFNWARKDGKLNLTVISMDYISISFNFANLKDRI
ncbi:hypothetical protein DW036_17210 [Bacteroides sp. AF39-11AC]|jgi:hypothetical protein|nr:hypothetical protein DW036_17210 [Bacteroides sp. AF39-11AC]